MAHVVAACSDCRSFTNGVHEFDVDADTVARLIVELDRRYPGLGAYITSKVAIAIDGEIHQDAHFVRLAPESEVYLIPRIGGG